MHARCDASAMWAAISLVVGSVEDASVSQWGGEDRKVSRGAELVFGSPRTLDELARPSRKLPSIYSILHHLPLLLIPPPLVVLHDHNNPHALCPPHGARSGRHTRLPLWHTF